MDCHGITMENSAPARLRRRPIASPFTTSPHQQDWERTRISVNRPPRCPVGWSKQRIEDASCITNSASTGWAPVLHAREACECTVTMPNPTRLHNLLIVTGCGGSTWTANRGVTGQPREWPTNPRLWAGLMQFLGWEHLVTSQSDRSKADRPNRPCARLLLLLSSSPALRSTLRLDDPPAGLVIRRELHHASCPNASAGLTGYQANERASTDSRLDRVGNEG